MWEDTRIGGFPRLYVEKPEAADLRIDSMLLRSVVYLAVKNDETEEPVLGGTACIVSLPSRAQGHAFQVLVTAGHCVKEMEAWGHQYIRVNDKNGKARLCEMTGADWVFASDFPATDLAATPLNLPMPEFDIALLPYAMAAFPPIIKAASIGVGDELYVVGLFTRRHGKSKNIPIVRTGTIAAMPDELIDEPKTGIPYHAYLSEIRSIGGLSGSPVFVDLRPGRVVSEDSADGGEVQGLNQRTIFLLGVIRGHWKKGAYEVADMADALNDDEERGMLNTGIATVTPIDRLEEIVSTPRWVEKREEVDRATLEKLAATQDASIPEPDDEFERFEDLTRKLVNTPKQKR